MKRLAIIPARGGSKRLPDKNIRDFCGKPMIGHILSEADKSGLFNTIHVSTDDAKIHQVATELGYRPEFSRPEELADDFTPLMPVLKFVVEEFKKRGNNFDEIWLLMACAPLVEAHDLQEAADLFEQNQGKNPLMSVTPYPAPVEWAYRQTGNNVLAPLEPGKFSIRSQDLETTYFETGCYTVFPSDVILNSNGAGSDSNFIGHILSKSKAVDIDDAEDWALAEAIYLGRRKQ